MILTQIHDLALLSGFQDEEPATEYLVTRQRFNSMGCHKSIVQNRRKMPDESRDKLKQQIKS